MRLTVFRYLVHSLIFLVALAPAAALAGGKNPVSKPLVRSAYRSTGKLQIVRVKRAPRKASRVSRKGSSTRAARSRSGETVKRGSRGKRSSRVVRMRISRPSTLTALGDALTGTKRVKRSVKKRPTKHAGVKKASSRRRVVIVQASPTVSSNLRDMARLLISDREQRQADLRLLNLD